MALLKVKCTLLLLLALFLTQADETQDITIMLPGAQEAPAIPSSDTLSTTLQLETSPSQDVKGKSVWGTAFLNLLLPGTGHLYLGDKRKATGYLTADALLWVGLIFTSQTAHRSFESASSYARTNAHTNSDRDKRDTYWDVLGDENFQTSQSYNEAQANNRDFDEQYHGDDAWSWDAPDYQKEYNVLRDEQGNWETASSILIGALVLNRVVAFIDGRVSAERFNNNQLKIVPTYSLESKTAGAMVLLSF